METHQKQKVMKEEARIHIDRTLKFARRLQQESIGDTMKRKGCSYKEAKQVHKIAQAYLDRYDDYRIVARDADFEEQAP